MSKETTFKTWEANIGLADASVSSEDGTICTLDNEMFDWQENAALLAAAPDLLTALKSLFKHCAMPHKHWGENSNQKEADAAIAAGLAAIEKAEGRS